MKKYNNGEVMKNNELEKLLSVPMVLEHFGISRSTLYKLTKTAWHPYHLKI